MSKQRTDLPVLQAEECCTPLGGDPLSADEASRLAPLTADPLTVEQAEVLSRRFKALGDPVRLRLLSLIASHQGGEACVCELTEGFAVSGPTISHHLRVLREAGLIEGDRRGTWIYYRVEPDALRALLEALLPTRVSA